MIDERVFERMKSLGELCTHNTDKCYECCEKRLNRALAVIKLQSTMMGFMDAEMYMSKLSSHDPIISE